LRCPADCRSACHACLLARDTQYDEAKLDRFRAMEYLRASILNRLELPSELAFFGPASRAEVVPLVAALDRAMLSRAEAALQVWMGGAPADWDFAAWPAVPLFEKWGAKGRSITLILHEDTAATLTNDQKIMLHGLIQRSRADLTTTPSLPKIGAAAVLARVRSAIGDETWVGRDPTLGIADAGWGKGHDSPIVVGSLQQGDSGWTRKIDVGALFQAATERADLIRVATEANGPVKGFGNRFWSLVLGRKPEIGQLLQHGGRLAEVIYQDRYLLSPLPVRLLCEVLRPVVNTGSGKPIDVLIRTKERRASEYGQIPMYLTDDWVNSGHRDAVALSALTKLGLRARIKAGHTRDLPHERTLWLRWEHGGELRIHLDQGFGHWSTTRPNAFPFTSRPEEQAAALLDTSFSILNRSAHPMSVFVLDIVLPSSQRAGK
jgi:DEAD/DEAH box helicase domain-containing protein